VIVVFAGLRPATPNQHFGAHHKSSLGLELRKACPHLFSNCASAWLS
jgi:hypothetical protein